ncbi:hypothetical protein FPOAC2_02838 [Fusarium poae]
MFSMWQYGPLVFRPQRAVLTVSIPSSTFPTSNYKKERHADLITRILSTGIYLLHTVSMPSPDVQTDSEIEAQEVGCNYNYKTSPNT